MAEAYATKPGSAAHASNVLSYGHYGTATYNPENQSWHFLRQSEFHDPEDSAEDDDTGEFSPFHLLAGPDVTRASPFSDDAQTVTEAPEYGSLSINAALKYIPQMCVASDVKLQSENSYNSDQRGYDWSTNLDRIALGSATVIDAEGHQYEQSSTPIMARICGPASSQIIFSCLDRKRITSDDEGGLAIDLEVPSTRSTEQTMWSSSTAIHSVAVSHRDPIDKGSCFAALTSDGTSLFQPAFVRLKNKYRLDLNFVLQIPILHTGGLQHVHAAYHPQSANHLALIDIEGNWSTWFIRSKRSSSMRNLQRARLLNSGSVPVPESPQSRSQNHPLPYPVGWHRIYWLASTADTIDRLLVCNSHVVVLLDLKGKVLQVVDFTLKGQLPPSRVLEVRPSEFAMNQYLVLTTLHLLQMAVDDHGNQRSDRQSRIRTVLSWNHFRNPSDKSLSMHVLESEKACWVLLSSCKTINTTVFLISRPRQNQLSISDPLLCRLPLPRLKSSDQVYLRYVQAQSSARKSEMLRPDIFMMFFYQDDKSLNEAVFSIRKTFWSDEYPLGKLLSVRLPSRRLMRHKSVRYVDESDVDDFITSDDEQQTEEIGGTSLVLKTSQSLPTRVNASVQDLSATYISVLDNSLLLGSQIGSQMTTFLEQARRRLEDESLKKQPNCLFSELSLSRPRVAEIEDESEILRSFIDEFKPVYYQTKPADTRTSLFQVDDRSLIEIYYDIVQDWMLALPAGIPERTRLARERLARQIALDIYLSNVIVRQDNVDKSEDYGMLRSNDQGTSSSANQTTDLDDLLLPPSSQLTNLSPVPEETSSATETTWSSLSKYVTFSKPLPERQSLESLDNIIFHLPTSIDTKPSTYSHTNKEAEFTAAKLNREHQQLDPRARRKAERLAKVRQRQLDRQEQVKKVTFDSRSAVPTITSSQIDQPQQQSQQHQLPIRNVQSSQIPIPKSSQTTSQGVNSSQPPDNISLSQPERGQYGGSSVKKSKKRKGMQSSLTTRNAGF